MHLTNDVVQSCLYFLVVVSAGFLYLRELRIGFYGRETSHSKKYSFLEITLNEEVLRQVQ